MAIILSDTLTTKESNSLVDSGLHSSIVYLSKARITVTSSPNVSDNLMISDIPSNARIHQIQIYNNDWASGVDFRFDLGVFASKRFTTAEGVIIQKNQAIVQNLFDDDASTFSFSNFPSLDNFRYNDATPGQDNEDLTRFNQELWEVANLTEDPAQDLRLGFTIRDNTGFTGTPSVGVLTTFTCR